MTEKEAQDPESFDLGVTDSRCRVIIFLGQRRNDPQMASVFCNYRIFSGNLYHAVNAVKDFISWRSRGLAFLSEALIQHNDTHIQHFNVSTTVVFSGTVLISRAARM